jgi:serine/threonine-protein kinase
MSSIPTTLGQYQIIREIARSNDIVYEAYDPLMNRRVAVKELAMPSGMTDVQKEDRINRFKREAQAAGTLNHTNIMTVYSFAEEAGRIFMALEFLDGHTLRNEIDTKGFVPIEKSIQIAIEVLEGLGHAHSKGVIHRDIKPDNIQILSNGQVKITDFGIARLTFQPNLTMDGQVFGTPSYMSPEQVVGREIDARSDLFSVGVVLYEMIAGQKPFAGDSVVSITYAIMNKDPEQPAQCTWSLWQVLSRALDKSPQLRYSSAAEMIEALREAERQAMMGTMSAPSNAYPASQGATGAYSNPMLPPAPQLSPYAQAPSPYPTAYNPYQAANPYQQAAPPVIQPGQYQPYMPMPANMAAGQYQPYNQTPGMLPPGPIPVYYPPPPREPLLKPDTIIFIRKAIVVFLIFGTIIALLFITMNAFVKAVEQGGAAKRDADVASEIAGLDPKAPIDERVEKANQLLNGIPADQRSASNQQTAVLYEEEGKKYLAENDALHAEAFFADGAKLDPYSAAIQTDLGALYEELAAGSTADQSTQVQNYQNSGQAWQRASQLARDPAKHSEFAERSAQTFYMAAKIYAGQAGSDSTSLRKLLYNAKEVAPPNSQIRGQVDQFLAAMNGGQ